MDSPCFTFEFNIELHLQICLYLLQVALGGGVSKVLHDVTELFYLVLVVDRQTLHLPAPHDDSRDTTTDGAS